jgi:outer membrane receptor protein involved in Fe transport
MLYSKPFYKINADKLAKQLVGIFIILFAVTIVNAQSDSLQVHKTDSLSVSNIDSLLVPLPDSLITPLPGSSIDSLITPLPGSVNDSLKVEEEISEENDTLNLSVPLYNHGKMTLIPSEPFLRLHKSDLQFPDYSDLSEILYDASPAYPMSLGIFGQYNQISMFGALPNNTNIRFDGRRYDDMAFNSTNLTHLPPEFMENIEVYVGSDAVIYGDNASGALINIQEMRYNTKKPYTRLWFQQAAFEYVAADAVFSQNFEKNWNLTFGLRALAHDGNYTNSWMESWNARANIRWNPSDRLSLSLTQNFINQGAGSNGGVSEFDDSNVATGELDIFDRLTANPIFENMNERVFRYDASFNASLFLAGDSASALSGSIYFSNFIWDNQLEDPFTTLNDSSTHYTRESYLFGAKGQYEQKLSDILVLRTGGDFYYNSMKETIINDELKGAVLSGFGHLTFNISSNLVLSGGVRLNFVRDKQILSNGAKLAYSIDEKSSLFFDLSNSERNPTPIEGLKLNRERNTLFLFGSKFDLGFNLDLGAFYRITVNPILASPSELNEYGNAIDIDFVNGEQRNIFGTYVGIGGEIFDGIFAKVDGQVYINDNDYEKLYPTYLTKLTAYYELIRNKSILRLGFEFGMIAEFNGYRYFPLKKGYYQSEYTIGTSPSGLNLFVKAKLGNAYVRLSYDNLLSNDYYYVSIYPQLVGNLRMTVSWPFYD